MTTAADSVRALLDAAGLGKTELSARSGVSRALIDDYLKGRRQPSMAQLSRLGAGAGLRLDVVWHRDAGDTTPVEEPGWAGPPASMDPAATTRAERALLLERVVPAATALRSRPRGELEFPPRSGRCAVGSRTPTWCSTGRVAVHRHLLDTGIANALGGALCLAYHVDDPRGTQDIDVNVVLPARRAREALVALPADVSWNDDTVAAIERDDQVRIRWPVLDELPIPLDLFFAVAALHDVAASRTVTVPMRGSEVPILGASGLTVFEALFAQTKDRAGIEAMLGAHDTTVDLDEAVRWVTDVVGPEDVRTRRLAGLRLHGR